MGLVDFFVQVGVAVGPATVYLDQVRTVLKKRNSHGFSKDVTAVILFSCIARIWFRVNEAYALALLVQAILLIVIQLFLLELLLRFQPGSYASAAFTASSEDSQSRVVFDSTREATSGLNAPAFKVIVDPPTGESSGSTSAAEAAGAPAPSDEQNESSSLFKNRPYNFWLWPDFLTYGYWLAGYTAVLGLYVLLLGRFPFFNGALGFYALGLEALLPLPQMLANYRAQSLAGLSPVLIAAWLGGDMAKTVYFVYQSSPPQFLVCGLIQLSIDLVICYQAYIYREKTADDNAALAEQASKAKARVNEDTEAEADAELDTRPTTGPGQAVEADDDDIGEASPFRIA
ncbi:unnamed protein product [Tilletia controversa]|uniref:PQ-loop repeat-containing protein 1 n=3 Tax=Tilletia TaxID=13289 RepID=A0A8X7SY72_9BASI|nr:hypothetical protein CF336_g1648 [Tilletia laevis]KAE8202535.1 hypothetical protein CF328_g2160 [Tilletia controversa]KAE8261197.1 hypothetical protein A4X03_0g3462 [Tilletia caries]KAE8206870.1 hypothetical protein CF335_g1557 [Tilletia laevis]KAE8251476.1 hypothetical protein A4X06_0g2666 [Tilletia controversa]